MRTSAAQKATLKPKAAESPDGASKRTGERRAETAELLPPDLLTTEQAARALGISPPTLNRERYAGRLKAIPHGHGFAYRRTEILEIGELRRKASVAVERERYEGERDARVFAAFTDGLTVDAAVIREQVAVTIVFRLRELWDRAHAAAQKAAICLHEHHGGECDGPVQTQVGLCGYHAARSRILTEEQALLLSGREIPTALHCQACSAVAARGICSSCMAAVTVEIEGEDEGRRLIVRTKTHILAIVGASRLKELESDRLDRVLDKVRGEMEQA